MASDSEASCVSDPNFAVICSFLEKFGTSCGVTSPDFLELQEMLENTQEVPQELIDLHIKLLRKVRRSVSADRWERVLIKLCHLHCSQDAWELERFGYKKARLSSKLRILKTLLETQFDLNQKFKAEVNRLSASELRTEPIGRDKHGHSYWYQIDEHCQLRVYREDPDEETWVLVANDREGLVRLISQLASDDPNLGDPVLNEDSNSLEIEKPILDTGQTSSSVSNCEADESSGGNEDSKDVPSEPRTETSPAETSATETSAAENLTVDEKPEVEEKPPESKLKFTISAGAIIPHITKEQPNEKSEKPVGIDLSVPPQPQKKGVDLTSKKKKSINDLAANLRMKSVDLLYKNPVQEQEMDLSVKKPRMDPKQFSSLSVPPFEPLSIESALRMSTEYEESDEEIDEEDELFDEDEIELPSHMKQPRLDRPTLLGKKKKTYSDDDEEYGEEIEEPVMLIQGEGSGKDCNDENTWEEYSEAVEEPVMFFYGEGAGHDCETGKEDETTNSDKNSNDLKDCELRTIKDTESATKSEVLESTEKTVLDCDSKDAKSDITSQEKDVSPKSHKIGTVMLDIKSWGPTSSKKISRWDIGKPDISKNVDRKELFGDSTNSSIKNNLDLCNVSKDETDNTISDTSVTDKFTAANKESERKLDESEQDKKETELKNAPADTHEALTDQKTDELQKSESLKTDDTKKQSMFFFGPGCFTFKTPKAPYSSDNKGSGTNLVESKQLPKESDQENETCTEKLKSESVPTSINKADILIDNKKQTTFLQSTNLSSELKSMDDTKLDENVNKDFIDKTIKSSIDKNVDHTENISEIKEITPEIKAKTSNIDNKESLPTEKVEENIESDNNSSILEKLSKEEVKNDVKETIIAENPETSSEKSIKTNLESTVSNEKENVSEVSEQKNSGESKTNVKTTSDEEETILVEKETVPVQGKTISVQEEANTEDTPEKEIKTDSENSLRTENKEKVEENIELDNNASIVEESPKEKIKNYVKDIGKNPETPSAEENKKEAENQSENLSELLETNLVSAASKENEIEPEVSENNSEENKIKETIADQHEIKMDTPEMEINTDTEISNKSEANIDLDESKDNNLNEPIQDADIDSNWAEKPDSNENTVASDIAEVSVIKQSENTAVCEQNTLENELNKVGTVSSDETVTSSEMSQNITDQTDVAEAKTVENVAQDESYIDRNVKLSSEKNITDETGVSESKTIVENVAQDESVIVESKNNTIEKNKSETDLNKIEIINSDKNLSPSEKSQSITDQTNIAESKTVEKVAQDESNIDTNNESCPVDEKTTVDSSETTKETDEITDDKSETLSETLESLSTLIETESKSDESDDQLKKSSVDDSSNSNLQIVESDSNQSIEENVTDTAEKEISQDSNQAILGEQISADEEKSVTAKKNTEITEDTEIKSTPEKEISVESTEKIPDSIYDNQINPEQQILVDEEKSETAKKNTENGKEELTEVAEINSPSEKEISVESTEKIPDLVDNNQINPEELISVDEEKSATVEKNTEVDLDTKINSPIIEENITDTEMVKSPAKSEEKDDLQLETEVTNKKSDDVEQVVSNAVPTEDISETIIENTETVEEKIEVDSNVIEPNDQKSNTDNIDDVSVSEKNITAQEDENKLIENESSDIQLSSEEKLNPEETKQELPLDKEEPTITAEEVNLEAENKSVAEIEKVTESDVTIKVDEEVKSVDNKVDTNLESIETKSESIADGVTILTENKTAEIVYPVDESASEVKNDETISKSIADEVTPTIEEKNNAETVTEFVSHIEIDQTKSETIADNLTILAEDKTVEIVHPVDESVSEIKNDESISEPIADEVNPTIEDKNNAETVAEFVSHVKSDQTKSETIADDLTISAEDKTVEIVHPVDESVSEVKNDESISEPVADEVTPTIEDKNNTETVAESLSHVESDQTKSETIADNLTILAEDKTEEIDHSVDKSVSEVKDDETISEPVADEVTPTIEDKNNAETVAESVSHIESDQTKSETIADNLTILAEDKTAEAVHPVHESVSEVKNDGTISKPMADEVTTIIEDKNKSETVTESASHIEIDQTKSETIAADLPNTIKEVSKSVDESVIDVQTDETKTDTVDDASTSTTKNKNEESEFEAISCVKDENKSETRADDLSTSTEDKTAEIVNPVVESIVQDDQNDEINNTKSNPIVDELSGSKHEENIDVANVESNSEVLESTIKVAEETKNIETELKSNSDLLETTPKVVADSKSVETEIQSAESSVETVTDNNESKPETVVNEPITEINKEEKINLEVENIDEKSLSKSHVDESTKMVDESIVETNEGTNNEVIEMKSSEPDLQAQINETSSDIIKKTIETAQESAENSADMSSDAINLEKENEPENLSTNSDSSLETNKIDFVQNLDTSKKKMEVVESKSGISNEPMVTENEQEDKMPNEETTAAEISKNETEVCSKTEPKVITKLKESQVEKILPCKDDISSIKDVKTAVSNSETVILADDDKKQNCNVTNESITNKTIESIHILEDQKDTEQNSRYFKNDSVEVNHVTIKNDIENKNTDDKIEKSGLDNPKEINKNKLDKKTCEEINKEIKETLPEKITDCVLENKKDDKINKPVLENSVKIIENKPDTTKLKEISIKLKESPSEKIPAVSKPPVTIENVQKNNESKTVKCTKITALKPEIGEEKSDKKIHEADKPEKSAKKVIIVNSHEIEIKGIKTSEPKENIKSGSVFDQIKGKKDTSAVSEIKKDSVNVQKEPKVNTGKIISERNEDSSDDDVMDSGAFDQGNDNNEDSEIEEITIVKKDNIQKEKPKLNHSEIQEKRTENKIVLKNIKDLIDPESEIAVHTIEVKKIDSIKEKLERSGVSFTKVQPKVKVPERKPEDLSIDTKPKLICVDITKLQAKTPSPPKPQNRTIRKLRQQPYRSSPRSLVPVVIDNEESDDVIDIPETDPLACSDEEALAPKKIEENTPRKPSGLSLSSFKLDGTEETDNSALIPAPIARALRNRKISVEATSKRKRSSDGAAVDGFVVKKRRGRGRPPINMGNRPEIEIKDSSSEDENESVKSPEVKVTTPQRGTGKARRGRGRGRGRGASHVERVTNDSPVLSSDAQSETSRTEVTPSPAEQKPPIARKKRRVLGLDIDPELIIKTEEKPGSDEHTTRSSVRQSRRIAQIKIKEQAERRKYEELTHVELKEEQKKKKKKKHDDKDYKQEKKKGKYKITTEEEESEEEIIESTKTKHKKKRKHQDLRKLFNTSNPWQSSSESSTSNEEEEEEEIEEEPTDEEAVLKSDHEFSPESDLESNLEAQPLRRARTVKKESDTEEPTDEHACQKCGKADHPEWILLCDKCDCGWHCSCLRPALLVIPEGDWFCPPCQHLSLIDALKLQLVDYDKKMNRKEMEVRRKERLAYVGISLDNVLPSKELESTKEDDSNTRDQQMGSGEDSSDSESGSESGSSSGDESEPIYQLRERRQAHSYRFNDYDELINSAIQDEMEIVKGAGNQGRGKDIATIVNAEKEEAKTQALLEQQKQQEPDFERPPPVVPVYEEKPPQEPEASEESSGDEPRVVPKHSGKKKHRKLNSLDISSEDDPDDDDDFKVTSASEEEDLEEIGSDDSDEMVGRRGRGKSGPTRRSTRARTKRFDEDFINDNSEDDAPIKKKNRSIWDESESEESDKDWGKKKRSKKQRHFSTPRTSKKSRKRKRRLDDSDPEVRSRPKKPKIKFGGLNDSDDEELLTRRTRGKKINYIDALGSDTDEDKPEKLRKTKPLESEEEYVANEEDDEGDEPVNPVEDYEEEEEEKDSESDTGEVPPPPIQRKIIKIIAPSKVAKGRGKGGMTRPQHLKSVTPPPVVPEPEPKPKPEELVPVPEPETEPEPEPEPEEVEEEEEPEPPVPDIPIIAANPDDLNEEEVGTMMMENEEYAKKQLELMAIQLAKEKKKKEKEAKKLEKKEALPVTPVVLPTGPKKRGRKKKSELEAIAAAAAAAAAATAAAEESPTTVNPALVSPVTPTNQLESPEKLTPPGEIPATISDLSNTPPKRRGRGKGRKTLEKEAAKAAVTGESPPTEVLPQIPPPTTPSTAISPNPSTMPNISAQTDPQNGGKLGIAAPPQPFSQNQPTPSVITRMLQSQPMSAMNQKYFPAEQQPPRGSPSGQFPRGRVPSPYRQPMYPGVRPMAPNSPHRLRSPGPPNMQMFHSTHHSMDPSPSGGGPINIAPNRDRNSPGVVGSPTPPPPPYNRAINRFSPSETSPGPSLPPPIRHHMYPQASPPPRPNFSPYHPPPPPNYHYGAYPPAPSLAAADDALPPTDYQGSPYPEYNTAEGNVNSSEGSNSKPFDEEGSGEFGGLVSYFSSQREDDLDT